MHKALIQQLESSCNKSCNTGIQAQFIDYLGALFFFLRMPYGSGDYSTDSDDEQLYTANNNHYGNLKSLPFETTAKQPVDIPLIKKIAQKDSKEECDDYDFSSPRTPPFTPTEKSFFFTQHNNSTNTENHEILSKTPSEDELMSELSKLLAEKLPDTCDSPDVLSPCSSSSSSSRSSISRRSSLMRKSPNLIWPDKYSPGNKTTYAKTDLSPINSSDTLTKDEDGNDSIHEEDENPNLFLKIDEIDGLPLSLSPQESNNSQAEDHNTHSPQPKSPIMINKPIMPFPVDEKKDEYNLQVKFKPQKKTTLKMNEKDYNLPVNSKLENELKRKANQITFSIENNDNYMKKDSIDFKPINKALLEWEYKSYNGFLLEVKNWFILLEGETEKHALLDEITSFLNSNNNNNNIAMDALNFNDFQLIMSVLHKSLGEFVGLKFNDENLVNDESLQLDYLVKNMLLNNFELINKDATNVISFLKQHLTLVKNETDKNILAYNKLVKMSTTIVYIMVCSCLEYTNKLEIANPDKSVLSTIEKFKDLIAETELLTFILDYVENWRFNFKIGMQLRQILALLDKLMMLQFGTEKEAVSTNIQIQKLLNPNHKHHKSNSSLNVAQYEALRQDLTTRYPEITNKITILEEYKYDISPSTAQFINVPRPKKGHIANMLANGKNVSQFDNNVIPNIQVVGSEEPTPYGTPRSSFSHQISNNATKKAGNQTNLTIPLVTPSTSNDKIPNCLNDVIKILAVSEKLQDYSSLQLSYNKLKLFCKEMNLNYCNNDNGNIQDFDSPVELPNLARIEKFYGQNYKKFKSLITVINKILANLEIDTEMNLILISTCLRVVLQLLESLKLQHILKYEYLSAILFDLKFIEISTSLLDYTYGTTDRFKMIFYHEEDSNIWNYFCKFQMYDKSTIVKNEDKTKILNGISFIKKSVYDNESEDININYLNFEYTLLKSLNLVISDKTQRLKFLPLNIGVLFKKNYQIFNNSLYKPILELVKQLTPFKSKKWKSEHMELITGVYMHLTLNILDNNWVTGKDTNGEIIDSLNIEFAMRELITFYNSSNYNF